MKYVQFVLPYPPSVNHYHTIYVDKAGNVRVRLTEKAKQYKRDAGWLARERAAGWGEFPLWKKGEQVSLELHVFRGRRQGDIDNTQKVLLDALNGVVWEDDRQIKRLLVLQEDDPDYPRVVVRVRDA